MMNISTVIPIYGLSQKNVDYMVGNLPIEFGKPFFVYNDNNSALSDYLESLAKEGVIECVFLPYQVGKTEAVCRGLQELFRISKPDIVVQIDGRGKQFPSELPNLIECLFPTYLRQYLSILLVSF